MHTENVEGFGGPEPPDSWQGCGRSPLTRNSLAAKLARSLRRAHACGSLSLSLNVRSKTSLPATAHERRLSELSEPDISLLPLHQWGDVRQAITVELGPTAELGR